MDYYGLNRQGAAVSGRYTRTPTPVQVARSPYAAQVLNAPDPVIQQKTVDIPSTISIPGGGTARGYPDPTPDDAATAEAREAYGRYGVSSNPFGGIARKAVTKGALYSALGAPASVAVNAAVNTVPTLATGLNIVNKSVPAELAIRSLGRDINALDPSLNPAERVAAKYSALRSGYPSAQPYTAQLTRKVKDAIGIGYSDPAKGLYSGMDTVNPETGTMELDPAFDDPKNANVGETETGISGTGTEPVGKDYGETGRVSREGGGGGEGNGRGGIGMGGSDVGGTMGRDGGQGLA